MPNAGICICNQLQAGWDIYGKFWGYGRDVWGDEPGQFTGEVQKWLFEVVVGLGRDFVVLQVLLSVEGNLLCFHLAVLNVHFVATQHNGNVLTHPARPITV